MTRIVPFVFALGLAACGQAAERPVRIPTPGTTTSGPSAPARRSDDCSEPTVRRLAASLVADEKEVRASLGSNKPAEAFADLRDRYRSLLGRCPDAPGLADAYAKFGGILFEAGAPAEAQNVWLSFVCHDRYPLPVPDKAVHLPQDRPRDAWARALAAADKLPPYEDPFPDGCRPLEDAPQAMIALGWYSIADFHFNELGDGGPYEINRALSAYRRTIALVPRNEDTDLFVRAVATYKLGFAAHRTGRYATSARTFGELLDLLAQHPSLSQRLDPSTRTDAVAYLAEAIGSVDLEGPPESAPSLPVVDPVDLVKTPAELERLLEPTLARLRDPSVLRSDALHVGDVYRAFAASLDNQNLFDLANRARDMYIADHPTYGNLPHFHADAVHASMASASMLKASNPARSAEAVRKAKERLATMKKMLKSGPWFDTHHGEPGVVADAKAEIERAENDVARRPPKKLPPSTVSNIVIH